IRTGVQPIMCGIAGWIDRTRDVSTMAATAEAVCRTLACRGPDGSGTYLTRGAALVHRRLAVVAPEGGQQPMQRQVGGNRYVITYNGELYNTGELRRDLEARGWTFATHCDTIE